MNSWQTLVLPAIQSIFNPATLPDFSMPAGTPIYVARKGIVMVRKNDFYKAATTKKYLPETNKIQIVHDDGSIANYAHVEFEKAVVSSGIKVESVQILGYSGDTGFSMGPH